MKAILILLLTVILIIAGCSEKTEVVVTGDEPVVQPEEKDDSKEDDTPQIKICSNNAEMTVSECEDSGDCTHEAWTCEEGDCPDGIYGYKCIVEGADEPQINQTEDNQTPQEPATTFVTNEKCVDGVISATFNNIWDDTITISSHIRVYCSAILNNKISCDKESIAAGESTTCTNLGFKSYTDKRKIVINHRHGKSFFYIDCGEQSE